MVPERREFFDSPNIFPGIKLIWPYTQFVKFYFDKDSLFGDDVHVDWVLRGVRASPTPYLWLILEIVSG